MPRALLCVLLTLFIFGGTGVGAALAELSTGQLVYVPLYSHIYSGNKERPLLLAATLSIRNTDPRQAITLISADYYDSEGKLIRRYLEAPVTLKPVQSTRFVVKFSDKAGGSGANFYVTWRSEQPANPPIIESIMIGTQNQLGISFTSRGRAVEGTAP